MTCVIQVFVQVWTATTKVTHDTCKSLISARHVRAGSYHAQNPSDQKWTDLLNKLETNLTLLSLSQYNDVQILNVQSQVVAGMNYKYTLSVDGKTCTFVYWEQSWTNTNQITSDTCGLSTHHKRAVGMPGGVMPQDPTDQKWASMLLNLSGDGLLDMSKNQSISVLSVGTQVVSGINTYFVLNVDGQKCELVYYSQPWTNTKEISKDTCNLKASAKRQLGGGLAGGWAPKDPSEQKWMTLLNQLDTQYNLLDLSAANGLEILGVQTQVVAGENYKLTLKVNGQTCEIVYFEQLWTNTHQIHKDTCGLKVTHKKRQLGGGLAGGWAPKDPSEQKWMTLLNQLDTQYNLLDLSSANGLEVLGVQTQVVAGENYKLTLKVNGQTCEIVYFEQLWTNTHEIHKDTCGLKVTHKKRQLLGGYTTQDTADPKWMQLLQDWDTKYHVLSMCAANDLRIVQVQQQVVAGFNYQYTLYVDGHICQMTLFEQAWTNTRQVTRNTCSCVKAARSLSLTALNTNTGSQKCLGAILDRVNAMSNDMFRLVDHHMTQTQVTSNGVELNYHVKMVLTESDCMNSGDSAGFTSVQCPPKQGSPIHTTWTADCRYDSTGTPAQVSNLNMVSH